MNWDVPKLGLPESLYRWLGAAGVACTCGAQGCTLTKLRGWASGCGLQGLGFGAGLWAMGFGPQASGFGALGSRLFGLGPPGLRPELHRESPHTHRSIFSIQHSAFSNQQSAISNQQSAVSCQRSAVSYQLSSNQPTALSAISCGWQLSAIRRRIVAVDLNRIADHSFVFQLCFEDGSDNGQRVAWTQTDQLSAISFQRSALSNQARHSVS